MTEPVRAEDVLAYGAGYRDAVEERKDRNRRLVEAEAVIQRVRQVLDAEQRRYNPPLGRISRIRNVLDGGAE